MKVVLTTGYEHSGYEFVHGILRNAGLVEAQPSRRERITAADLQVKLLKAFAESGEKLATGSPGKLWEELAVDLFLTHLETPVWGWADHNTLRLLDFWRRFDKQTRFVLVYSSPEFAIGQALQGRELSPDDLSPIVQAWTNQTKALLRFHRRFSGRCELVNCAGALRAPQQLIERLSERWGISLQLESDYTATRHGISAVASSLARCVVRECDDAGSLYATLESYATVIEGLTGPTEVLRAWNEYSAERQEFAYAQAALNDLQQKLISANTQAATALEQQRQQVTSITKAREEQQALANERQRQIQQLSEERDLQTKLAAERQQQIGVLTKLRDESQAQAKLMKQQVEKLTADRLIQIDNVKKQAPAHARAAGPSLTSGSKATLKELQEENELLLLQLHQVQEELEHRYLENQELLKKSHFHSYLYRFLQENQPSEVVIDFRGEICGENWYHAEEDGRWAGPQKASMLWIPGLLPGDYSLQIDVSDAMTMEILAGMEVHVNGDRVHIEVPGAGYPALVEGRFRSEKMPDDQRWHIEFRFKELMSPKQRGESDDRKLAVRIQSLHLILDEPIH